MSITDGQPWILTLVAKWHMSKIRTEIVKDEFCIIHDARGSVNQSLQTVQSFWCIELLMLLLLVLHAVRDIMIDASSVHLCIASLLTCEPVSFFTNTKQQLRYSTPVISLPHTVIVQATQDVSQNYQRRQTQNVSWISSISYVAALLLSSRWTV